jgi:ketosteroid isomerase-like protein
MGNKQTYEAIQTAVMNGDVDQVRSYLSDDFVMYEPPGLPYSGEIVGPDGFIDLTRKIRASYDVSLIKAELTEAGDELLVCEYIFGFKSLRTGEYVEQAVVDLMRFNKDGKLVRGDIYYTDAAKIGAIA